MCLVIYFCYKCSNKDFCMHKYIFGWMKRKLVTWQSHVNWRICEFCILYKQMSPLKWLSWEPEIPGKMELATKISVRVFISFMVIIRLLFSALQNCSRECLRNHLRAVTSLHCLLTGNHVAVLNTFQLQSKRNQEQHKGLLDKWLQFILACFSEMYDLYKIEDKPKVYTEKL